MAAGEGIRGVGERLGTDERDEAAVVRALTVACLGRPAEGVLPDGGGSEVARLLIEGFRAEEPGEMRRASASARDAMAARPVHSSSHRRFLAHALAPADLHYVMQQMPGTLDRFLEYRARARTFFA